MIAVNRLRQKFFGEDRRVAGLLLDLAEIEQRLFHRFEAGGIEMAVLCEGLHLDVIDLLGKSVIEAGRLPQ